MKKRRYGFLTALLIFLLLCAGGCGGLSRGGGDIPVPEEYGSLNGAGTEQEEAEPASFEEAAEEEAEKTDIRYFLDMSETASWFRNIEKAYAAAVKCAAGYEERHFYGINDRQQLTEVSEQRALSGQFGNTAPVDWLERGELPYNTAGVNILSTDLQSGSISSELGRWLVDTGSTGYSFYVFPLDYVGSIEFKTYISSSELRDISVRGCDFPDKELLLIAFGNDELVEEFDSFLELASSRCFTENVANVELDNTNYVYGMQLVATEDADFTCENTFVYKKSRLSANKAQDAVRAVLYAVPDPGVEVPAVAEEETVVKVLEYDEEAKCYQDSDVTFSISTKPYLDGFPSAVDDPESDRDEALGRALGEKIVEDGPVFTVTAENGSLPKGLYAVEVQLAFEPSGEAADLQEFASAHSAGLEEYSAALRSECRPLTIGGEQSDFLYVYTGDEENSAFRKLLDFEKLTDELIAAGAVAEGSSQKLVFRLIIDNR